MRTIRCAVVGGGILGVAVAAQLCRSVPGAIVTVFEKEPRLAAHQTGHNSGVVHAGLYYEPGSLKARLCRHGSTLIAEYAASRDVPFQRCGKLVVATTASELSRLEAIHERALANGVPGVRMLDRSGIAAVEPHVVGIAAVHSPATAITDYVALTNRLAEDVASTGGVIHLGTHVKSVRDDRGQVRVDVERAGGAVTTEGPFDLAVLCAGLQSDRLAVASGARRDPVVVPFFGDYYRLAPARTDLVRGLVYPVPDPTFPFLGVHLTRQVDGGVVLGPNAFLALAREEYSRTAVRLPDVAATLGTLAFWRFAAHNAPAAFREIRTVLSRRAFVAQARRFVPEIEPQDVTYAFRGIRAQSLSPDGSLVDDFVVQREGRVLAVRNAPSPAATSSMAIAEHIVELACHG